MKKYVMKVKYYCFNISSWKGYLRDELKLRL